MLSDYKPLWFGIGLVVLMIFLVIVMNPSQPPTSVSTNTEDVASVDTSQAVTARTGTDTVSPPSAPSMPSNNTTPAEADKGSVITTTEPESEGVNASVAVNTLAETASIPDAVSPSAQENTVAETPVTPESVTADTPPAPSTHAQDIPTQRPAPVHVPAPEPMPAHQQPAQPHPATVLPVMQTQQSLQQASTEQWNAQTLTDGSLLLIPPLKGQAMSPEFIGQLAQQLEAAGWQVNEPASGHVLLFPTDKMSEPLAH